MDCERTSHMISIHPRFRLLDSKLSLRIRVEDVCFLNCDGGILHKFISNSGFYLFQVEIDLDSSTWKTVAIITVN